jgi:hypothetical protein
MTFARITEGKSLIVTARPRFGIAGKRKRCAEEEIPGICKIVVVWENKER